MKKTTFFCAIFLSVSLIANSQINRSDVKSVLSGFLRNSYDGRYQGWSGNSKDSLRGDATKYYDRIKSIDKSFGIEQGDNVFYILSYSLDSIVTYTDYSVGFVSIVYVANGYCMDRFTFIRESTNKRYLLIKENGVWFVMAETKDWYVSVSAYIKWAEKYLSDNARTQGPEYLDNVKRNLKDFKEFNSQK